MFHRMLLRRISSIAVPAMALQFVLLGGVFAQLTPPAIHPVCARSVLDWDGIPPYGRELTTSPVYSYSNFQDHAPPSPIRELYAAIKTVDLAKIKFVLNSQPALVNSTEKPQYPGPPLVAAFLSHKAVLVVPVLLAYGANVNPHTRYQYSPLSMAMSSYLNSSSDQNEQLVEMLIAHGADVNSQDFNGQTILQEKIRSHDLFGINFLLNHGAKLNETGSGHSSLLGVINSNPNSAAIVQRLVDAGADVNRPLARHLLPIHFAMHLAASRGVFGPLGPLPPIQAALTMERILAAKGADINAADDYGMTPLLFAITNHDPESIAFLKTQGARQDVLTKAFLAAAMDDVPDLKESLKSNTALTLLRDPEGRTLLHVAAMWGAVEAADFLLQQGADVNCGDPYAETPFYTAIAFHSGLPMLSLLISHFADVNRVAQFSSDNFNTYRDVEMGYNINSMDTPLQFAIRSKDVEEVDLLLTHGAEINLPSKPTGSLFQILYASASDPSGQVRTLKIAKRLLAKGADLALALKKTSPSGGDEPSADGVFEEAIANNNQPLFQFFMFEGQPYLDFTDKDFFLRALLVAAREARPEILTSLLARGKIVTTTALLSSALRWAVDPIYDRTFVDTTHRYSFDTQRIQTIRLLLAAGADTNAVDKNFYNGVDKISVLMHAVSTGELPIVQLLLEKGASVNALDDQGDGVLDYAIRHTDQPLNTAVVRLLLDRGASVDGQSGITAYFLAVAADRADVVKLLLAKSIDVNAKTSVSNNSETALIGAVRRFGSKDLVQVLLKAGVDVNAKAADGKTALAWALSRNDLPLAAVLRHAGATE